jgi:hypothetical protein
MKKTMLWGALFTIICSQVQAEVSQQPVQVPSPDSVKTPVVDVQPINQAPADSQAVPVPAEPITLQPVPITPAVQPAPLSTSVQPLPAPVINCEYKIPAQTKVIDQTLVLSWSEKAVTQAFDFDSANVDNQMLKLKECFTDQGWAGFNTALLKSGNIEAIKTQKLTVSSQVDGQTQIIEAKDNQWKITMPLQVVYQNDKEKVTQLLNVNVTIGRKISGDLGMIQMIANPRPAAVLVPTNHPTTPNSTDQTTPANPVTPPTTTNLPPTGDQVPSNKTTPATPVITN